VHAGGPIDPDRCRIIGIDFIGGPGASTSAANSGHLDAPFPSIDSSDQARAIRLLLAELGIERLRAVIGSSYGGMVGLALAAAKDVQIDQLLLIGAAHESHPMATAWRSLQRKIVHLGVEAGRVREALVLARSLAMTTYRTSDEFARRFSGEPSFESGLCRFPVEDYLDARGRDFADRFSVDVFSSLSESIDLHRVDPAEVSCSVTIVATESDVLVPLWQCEQLAADLAGPTRLVRIRSEFGHDAFLKEVDQLSPIIRAALAGEELSS
jgi:homoserine O-acetyltransferase